MFEKLLATLLTEKEKITAKSINFLLCVFLILVTYSKWINEIKFDVNKVFPLIISGHWILFSAWATCVVALYHAMKFLLIKMLTGSQFAVRLFVERIIPEEYRVPILNVYYKKTIRASKEYIEKAVEYQSSDIIDNVEVNKSLNILISIVIKFILLITIIINDYSGVPLAVLIFALVISIIVLLYFLAAISSVQSKLLIYKILKEAPL